MSEPDDIGIAQKLLAGEAAPRIPNGRVVRGEPDVNVGYSWHIDPDSVAFADTATEVCDGRPSGVEKRDGSQQMFIGCYTTHKVNIQPDV